MSLAEDYMDYSDVERYITCKYCGETGLHWKEITSNFITYNMWGLFNDKGERHKCRIVCPHCHGVGYLGVDVEDMIPCGKCDTKSR